MPLWNCATHRDNLHETGYIQIFIKTVQFIIINGMRCLYKNEHSLHYYTEKFYNTFVTKISTGLNTTDILANTFYIVQLEPGGGNKETHTCFLTFLTRHLKTVMIVF
jgi:hypothetical protein